MANNLAGGNSIIQAPIVEPQTGRMTFQFTKWFQDAGNRIQNGLDQLGNLIGTLSASAHVAGRVEPIGTTLQNLDSTGAVTSNGVDFTRAYLNKTTDHITDGTGNPLAGGKRGFQALNANAQLTGSFRNNPVNVAGTYTATNPLTQSGTSKTINVAANTQQFGDGPVSYSSGSVTPAGYGLYYVYADDSNFQGGAVTYQTTQNTSDLTANNGRVYFGQITTAAGGGGSGSGGGGGCVEVGTPVLAPKGTTREILDCSDWIALRFNGHEPVYMHPDTLVATWKQASELHPGDRISVGREGRWRNDWEAWPETRPSKKVKRTCPGGRYLAGTAQIELHNAKPLS